jgi:3-deoxy-D-manno-octulosonic-acid transferase
VPYLLDLCYLALLIAVWPWLVYQGLRKGKYREGFAAKFLGRVPTRSGEGPCLWFHAVSVGEVNLLAPLLAQIRRHQPHWRCVVSTTTMTGFALARKKYADLTVFYCPLDFSWATRAAVRRVRPTCLVLVELELWPNLIRAARRQGATVAIINGRLSQRSFRGYRRLRPLVAGLLRQVDLVAAQNEEYAERFRALGARRGRVHTSGSMKFDGAQTNRRNATTRTLCELAGIEDSDVVFLAGSTQEPEEALALAAYRDLSPRFPRLRLVLVPRHPDRFPAVARLLAQSGLAWQRRSELQNPSPSLGDGGVGLGAQPSRVLLVDAVGELAAWWGTAHIAFVGGSLGNRGGQNMIEPAAYGAAVSFGPNTRNFRDVVAQLIAAEAAVVVRDGDGLTAWVRRCLEDRGHAETLGRRAQALVAAQLGATSRTLELLRPLVEPDASASQPPKSAAA